MAVRPAVTPEVPGTFRPCRCRDAGLAIRAARRDTDRGSGRREPSPLHTAGPDRGDRPCHFPSVFGEDGGHAGNTETAYMMAIDPQLIQRKRYRGSKMATAIPAPNTWNAYPFPSSILVYKEGEGYPDFDLAKAKSYFTKVNDKVARLIGDTIRKWDSAGL